MLNWFFKKRGSVDAPTAPAPAPKAARPLPEGGTIAASAKARPAAAPEVNWSDRLRAATGDDALLLQVAESAPQLAVKIAAVDALASEGALRQAERAFRSHDRKVHRLAKQRLETAVAQREARARAETLLQRTAALIGEAEVPINHLVELDRDWQALPADLLEPDQRERFAAQRARLDTLLRERGDEQQRVRRWIAEAERSLPEFRHAVADAADHGVSGDLGPRTQALIALRASRPDGPATAALDAALAQALEAAAGVEARLAWFEAQLPPTPDAVSAAAPHPVAAAADTRPDGAAAEGAAPEPAPPAQDPSAGPPGQRWDELPPLPDVELARMLDERHARWLRARRLARPVAAVPPPAAAPRTPRPASAEAPDTELQVELEALLQQAEAALAEGQLGTLRQHLQAIDAALARCHPAALPAAWRARHQALRAEGARLKGWQQWGGARARNDLTAEAEELARQAQAAVDPAAADAPKLNLQRHADAIQALRARWKELDRLGAVASQALWQRFDAALQAAYQPVAAQHAARQAARQENLAAREALLAGLEALPVPEGAPQEGEPDVDARGLMRELQAFRLAWRQLGPLEHTVPAAARDALQQRLRLAVDRIEAPLHALQRAATAAREQLIGRAEALVPAAGTRPHWVDAGRQARELQAEWQDQARRCPLPRAVEGALWERFRAATDAVFAQRDAESAARDATLSTNLAECEALLARLSALGGDTPVADIERTLADVDRAWRQVGELPRGAGEAVEGRFRAARRRWEDQCDTLVARLALCEEREAAGAGIADSGPPWAADGALPAAWEEALARRWSRSPEPGPLAADAVDELLLRLEAALNLPSAPEWLDARRHLKLRALKEAMEGRAGDRPAQAQPAEELLAALRQSGLSPAQRDRLHALVAALRQALPGIPGAPTAAAAGIGRPLR